MLAELLKEIPLEGIWLLFIISVLSLIEYRWGVILAVTVFGMVLAGRYFGW